MSCSDADFPATTPSGLVALRAVARRAVARRSHDWPLLCFRTHFAALSTKACILQRRTFFGSGVEFETFALLRSSSSLCESDRLNPNPQPRFLSPAPSTEGKLLGAAFPFLS